MSEYLDREATVKQICKMGEMVGGHDRDVVISIALFVQDDKTAFPTEERPHEKWDYLKEHITEMRDADGELNQKDTCKFILELMGVIEREGKTEC